MIKLTVPQKHQRSIALKTLKLTALGASVMGGMNHKQAIEFLRSIGYHDTDLSARLKTYGHSTEDILEYMK